MNTERFKQSKHYFALNKASPYHTTITCLLNFLQLNSNQIKPTISASLQIPP